jgi:hypothetical protein
MNSRHKIVAYIGVLALLTLSAPALAELINEEGTGIDDANSLVTTAQSVDISSGSLTISGELLFSIQFFPPPIGMSVFRTDVDFYSFFASARDEITVNIDQGVGGARSIDTKLGLFGPAPDYVKLAENDDSYDDDGDGVFKDPRIDGFVIPASGVYTIVVTGRGSVYMDGGEVGMGAAGNGDYLLKISGASALATVVDIAISPEKKKRKKKHKAAKIDLKKKKDVKVAILGSRDFPVSEIDTSSLTFGAVGNEKTLRKCKSRTKDVNRDGEPDLECKFSLRHSGFSKHSLEGVLNGQTSDGRSFSGADLVEVKGKLKKKKG